MEIDLSTKCRTCLADEPEMHSLFSEFDDNITLADLLVANTDLKCDANDGFSEYLCQKCTSILVDFHNFREIYNNHYNHFKSMICEKNDEDDDEESANETAEEEEEEEPNVKQEDEENVNFSCEICGKIFEYESTYQQHIISHQNELIIPLDPEEGEPNVCTKCSSTFPTHADLTKHYETHHSHTCDYCGKSFRHLKLLNHHKRIHANTSNVTECELEFEEVLKYRCEECNIDYSQTEEFESHMNELHDLTAEQLNYDEHTIKFQVKINQTELKEGEETFPCKFCSEVFVSLSSLVEHKNIHKTHVCEKCGVGFTKRCYLVDHYEVHDAVRRHVCQYCGKAFKRRTVLTKHKRIHTNPRSEMCTQCGKLFNDKTTLSTHVKLIHLKTRDFLCLVCGLKFPLKSTLEKHVRRHGEDRESPFNCLLCRMSYKDKSSLNRHVSLKHSADSPVFKCDICLKKYTTRTNLNKHQRTCHAAAKPNEESEVREDEIVFVGEDNETFSNS